MENGISENAERGLHEKPRMLLKAPKDCKHKRVWHFLQLFPLQEFEYCTNIALRDNYEEGGYVEFDGIAYLAAWSLLEDFDSLPIEPTEKTFFGRI